MMERCSGHYKIVLQFLLTNSVHSELCSFVHLFFASPITKTLEQDFSGHSDEYRFFVFVLQQYLRSIFLLVYFEATCFRTYKNVPPVGLGSSMRSQIVKSHRCPYLPMPTSPRIAVATAHNVTCDGHVLSGSGKSEIC